MRLSSWLRSLADRFLHRSRIDRELQEELRSHIQHRADDLERSGLARAEAERRARIEFGGYERFREESHEAAAGHHAAIVERGAQDLVFAVRSARRTPLLTAVVILALSIGIGLNTAVFSLLNVAILQPPVKNGAASFVQLYPRYEGWFSGAGGYSSFTAEDYDAIRSQAHTLRDAAALEAIEMTLDDAHAHGVALLVSCNYFQTFGFDRPLLGRYLRADECKEGTAVPVVVVAEHYWKHYYDSDPKIVGKVIHAGHQPLTVIGVAPDSSVNNLPGGLLMPYTLQPVFSHGDNAFRNADSPWLNISGRLSPGYSRADAKAELETILHQRDRLYVQRKVSSLDRKTSLVLTNGSEIQNPAFEFKGILFLGLILGPLFLVLLLACINVTMLFLSRSVVRRGETAVRLALGAGRTRLVRMLGTESLLTAGAAGAISVFLAYQVPKLILGNVDPGGAVFMPVVEPDWKVFAYLAALVLVASVVPALVPIRESFRLDLVTTLKGREGSVTTRSGMTSAFIVMQLAIGFVCLTAAVLFARLPSTILNQDPGLETRQVMAVPLRLDRPPYTDATALAFYRNLEARLLRIPGVQSLAYASIEPFHGVVPEEIRLPGQDKGKGRPAAVDDVSADFFSTFGIPMVHGRAFQHADSAGAKGSAVAIVSETFAKNFWGDGVDPVGRMIVTQDGTRLTVVGVARNTRSERFGLPEGSRLYTLRDPQSPGGTLSVRFHGDASATATAMEEAVRSLDPDQVDTPETLRHAMEFAAAELWSVARIILFMGAIAVLLAVTGVYGVLSFAVSQRTREFGIRMVLGATRQSVFRSVMMRGVRQIALGLLCGAVLAAPGAWALKRISPRSIVSIDAFDPAVFGPAAAVLVLVALVAMYLPAFRATKVDPMQALRNE